ncbi:MAG: helix-hairpin-helix domain-containing protein [Bacteroidota bacterium]
MLDKKYVKSKGSCKVTFKVPSEQVGEGRDVRVLGDFNNWSWDEGVPMARKNGHYTGTLELPATPAHYQFRYLVDGQQWLNDNEAERFEGNIYGTTNCVFSLEALPTPAKKKPAAKKPTAKKATAAKKPAAKKATAKKAAPKAAAKATAKPKAKAKKDDLKKIEGIGPKIAGLLNDAGIVTFNDLAEASKGKLKNVLEAAGPRFRLAKPDTWQQQAKLAAAGKDAELAKLQDELKGGVKK